MASKRVSQIRGRFRGDALATLSGLIFFVLSVGVEKLNPQNIGWLIFSDQKTHWIGWRFFASDAWRWPLGANPNYGWQRMNSIVFTDSFPGLAIIFKAVDLEMFNNGQYFGFGLLLGAIALFIGAHRLFAHLGMRFGPALLASAILSTTPVFWWMQRWYPALSSGVPLLVWSFYFYIDRRCPIRVLAIRWTVLLCTAVLTHAYLVVTVFAFFVATVTQRFLESRAELRALGAISFGTTSLSVILMYILGYYTVPSKWAQTGGYGWYSANLLGLIDPNGASRWIPNLPSMSGQYEPTSLSTGSLLLFGALILNRLFTQKTFGLQTLIRKNLPLAVVLTALLLIATTNTISIGTWIIKLPIPQRLEHGLSIFRSSARFLWPTIIVLSTFIIVLAAKRFRFATAAMAVVLLIQVVDYRSELEAVAKLPNDTSIAIEHDVGFWEGVPSSYTKVAAHPAESLGPSWAECAYAAVQTSRIGQCGYFSRVQDLKEVNALQSEALLSGNLDRSTIYWVSVSWLKANQKELLVTYDSLDREVLVARIAATSQNSSLLVVSGCQSRNDCSFLGDDRQALGQLLRGL
jgi:hypothetical protein